MFKLLSEYCSSILPVLGILFLISCEQNPEALLDQARSKINDNNYIHYRAIGVYPSAVEGKADTIDDQLFFSKNDNRYLDYDYIHLGGWNDNIYINDQFQQVIHESDYFGDSIVFTYSPAEQEKFTNNINEIIPIEYSPITFLSQAHWQYRADTTIEERLLRDYYYVEMDTTIKDNYIYVEGHVFINPSSKLLERYERQAFLNGKENQIIVYQYTDYQLAESAPPLTYDLPKDYTSGIYSDSRERVLVQTGQVAPNFKALDIDNNEINLESQRGQKVLLNFSIINCGYCYAALKYFNAPENKVSSEIRIIYINPTDNKSDLITYSKKVSIPFPVIASANRISEAYGISGYPTFVLVNENGIVEEVFSGFKEDFLDRITKS